MKKDKNIIEVESVTINIGDTTVKVTPMQCRELYNALAQLLGEPRYTYTRPYWWYGGVSSGTYTIPGTTTVTNCDSMRDVGFTLTSDEITIQ